MKAKQYAKEECANWIGNGECLGMSVENTLMVDRVDICCIPDAECRYFEQNVLAGRSAMKDTFRKKNADEAYFDYIKHRAKGDK